MMQMYNFSLNLRHQMLIFANLAIRIYLISPIKSINPYFHVLLLLILNPDFK